MAPQIFYLTIDASKLTAGTYTDTIHISGAESDFSLPVILQLAPAKANDVQGVWVARSWNGESLSVYAGQSYWPYQEPVYWNQYVDSVTVSIGGDREIPGRYALRYAYRKIPVDPSIPGEAGGASGDAGLYVYENAMIIFDPQNTGTSFELDSAIVVGGGLIVHGDYRDAGAQNRHPVTWFFVRPTP